jgi:zinc transport system substrate-binding protein
MKTLRFLVLLLLLCSATFGKPLVISSVYPLFDFVSLIAEDKVALRLLVPPNNDPHSFEPTPKDIVNLTNADLFLYISPELEPWSKKFAQKAKRAVSVADGEDDHAGHDHEEGVAHDPHIWLDPNAVIEIIEKITANLCAALPQEKVFFEKNAQNLISQIADLDAQYKNIFADCNNKKVFFAGHNSFTGFAARYDLTFVPVTQSYSSTSEPSAKQVAKIVDDIKKSGAKFIYYDALSNTSLAKTVAKETGTQILPLYSIHTASKDDFAAKIHYVEYMKRNYENIAKAMECRN